jgi:hypothetical protein
MHGWASVHLSRRCDTHQWKAPTPDLEGHRKRLREALGNTLSDEFVDVILGKKASGTKLDGDAIKGTHRAD